MIDHTSVAVADYDKSKEFYAKALAPLGYSLGMDLPQYKVAGFVCEGRADFWVGEKSPAGAGHTAFLAKDKAAVQAFYDAGLAAGGSDNGPPGYRKDYSPGYWGAFVRDPDGNNIEAVWHDPNPPAE